MLRHMDLTTKYDVLMNFMILLEDSAFAAMTETLMLAWGWGGGGGGVLFKLYLWKPASCEFLNCDPFLESQERVKVHDSCVCLQ